MSLPSWPSSFMLYRIRPFSALDLLKLDFFQVGDRSSVLQSRAGWCSWFILCTARKQRKRNLEVPRISKNRKWAAEPSCQSHEGKWAATLWIWSHQIQIVWLQLSTALALNGTWKVWICFSKTKTFWRSLWMKLIKMDATPWKPPRPGDFLLAFALSHIMVSAWDAHARIMPEWRVRDRVVETKKYRWRKILTNWENYIELQHSQLASHS